MSLLELDAVLISGPSAAAKHKRRTFGRPRLNGFHFLPNVGPDGAGHGMPRFRTIQAAKGTPPVDCGRFEPAAKQPREEAAMLDLGRREFITLLGGARAEEVIE